MPKLWEETIQAHRGAVREAVIETTWRLVREHGLRAVTMSQVAVNVGIGRATLYKYFPDVETILLTGHHQYVIRHLEHLEHVAAQSGTPLQRLRAVLQAYAHICRERGRHSTEELGALVHRSETTRQVEEQLHILLTTLIEAAATADEVRADVPAAELAQYCAHALTAAAKSDTAAAQRLVDVCVEGMRP